MLVVGNTISMPDLEEACCDCTLLGIDFKTSPVAVEGDLVGLVLEGSGGVGNDGQVISKGSRAEVVLLIPCLVKAAKVVSMSSLVEPSEKGFYVKEEECRGERVSLQSASLDRDGVSKAKGSFDSSGDSIVESGNDSPHVCWEA